MAASTNGFIYRWRKCFHVDNYGFSLRCGSQNVGAASKECQAISEASFRAPNTFERPITE